MITQKDKAADYYDQTIRLYRLFWHGDKSYALHYGFWDKDTKNRQDTQLNENKFLAHLVGISSGAKILDAGCGIGGSAIWLAQNFNVHVTGITISKLQLAKAKKLAIEHGLEAQLEFDLQDFLRTKFPDNSFDIVWAIESVCHAEDKRDFLAEAHRILKPRGKLIVADGFLKRDIKRSEERDYKKFIEGFALPNIAKMEDFKSSMKELGFKNIISQDKTKDVKRSSEIIYRGSLSTYPLAKILCKLGLLSEAAFRNSWAGIAQYRLVKSGAAGYGAFYGEKPS